MFVKLLARLLGAPMVTAVVVRLAKRNPYFDIYVRGELYMRRWWLLPRFAVQFNPQTGAREPKAWHRWWWRWCPVARVHHIVRPDADLALHDHPFDFRTFVLDGWYRELDVTGNSRIVLAGDTYRSAAERFHRIEQVDDAGVWTLFCCGPRRNSWGFLVNGRKVGWRTYLDHQA